MTAPDIGPTSQIHEQFEVRGRVHRGPDHLRVVQVEAAHVESHGVSAERAGDDPAAPFAQQRQALAHQLARHDVERDVDALRSGGADLLGDVFRAVQDFVRACRARYITQYHGTSRQGNVIVNDATSDLASIYTVPNNDGHECAFWTPSAAPRGDSAPAPSPWQMTYPA